MNNLTELDYAFIMCFKRSQWNNADLLRNLMIAQSEWAGIDIEYIGLSNVAYMLTSTVASLGLLGTERGMHNWYDYLRTEALYANINEHEAISIAMNELGVPEPQQRMARFYINYIFGFSCMLRLLMVDSVPGLREYFEANKDKWDAPKPLPIMSKPV